MTTLTTSALPVPFAQAFAGIASAAGRLGRRVVTAWRHRRDATMLASFDERMLRDIGLTRTDLNDALSEPVWRDPTAILVSRVHERRINRRRTSVGLTQKAFDAPSIVPSAKTQAMPAVWKAY